MAVRALVTAASRGVGRLESKASAMDWLAKAEALDSNCAALAGTMIKASIRPLAVIGNRYAFMAGRSGPVSKNSVWTSRMTTPRLMVLSATLNAGQGLNSANGIQGR